MIESNNPMIDMATVYKNAITRVLNMAQLNPVLGGVNAAQTQQNIEKDFVSNAMNEQPVTAIPQLMGAKATVTGGAGGSGIAHGIGQALANMYNSRIARSENEVAQAQHKADMEARAQAEAARQKDIFDREDRLAKEKEAREQASPKYAEELRNKRLHNEVLEKSLAKASGGSGSGGPGGATDATRKGVNALLNKATVVNPETGETTTDWTGITKAAVAGDPNAKLLLRQRNETYAKDAVKKDKETAKTINDVNKEWQRTMKDYNNATDDRTKAALAEKGRQLKDRLNSFDNPNSAPTSTPQAPMSIPKSSIQYDENGNAFIVQ